MQDYLEKLRWIVDASLWADAAIAAELEFVGAPMDGKLHPTALEELSFTSLTLDTKVCKNGQRVFGFERCLDESVQKVLGFDFGDVHDLGTEGNT